ncbi:hypothetical protein MACJ_001598 [Theileria orientalis]|uniref:RRM domain-containing protein n=1 Tax=Theileria orientalis TaxID=68886 RepID=A0A976QSN3_THEOR|nr:hypothetical protein MACJ_001598 [Theileria orientalis]
MTNSFNNDIPDIYTDSSGDSSDDDGIKDLVSFKANNSEKSAPNSQESKTPDKVGTLSQSTPKDTPKKAVLSDATSSDPMGFANPGSKSPKSPKPSTKKGDKENKDGKNTKKAVKKQEAKKAKASDTNDIVKDKLKELVKGDREAVESAKVEVKEIKETKDLTVTFDKEPKKKARRAKAKDDTSSAPSSKVGSAETSVTTSEAVSQSTSGASTPKRKKAKKAPAPKEEGKVADGMDLDKPDATVKVDSTVKEVSLDTVEKVDKPHKVEGSEEHDKPDRATKSEKSDAAKRKTKGETEPKPKKPRVSKAAKSAEAPSPALDKPVETATEDKGKPGKGKAAKKLEKGEKSEKGDKVKKSKKVESSDKPTEEVHKGLTTHKSPHTAKTADKDKMTNDEVFDALSKLDDIPLGELKDRIRALAPSESDSDSDSDSSSGDSDSSVDLKALLKAPFKEPGVDAKDSDSDTDSDTDSDSDSDDSDDAFIGPVKPTVGASDVTSGLIGSGSDDTDSDDSDDSDESVEAIKPAKPAKVEKKEKVKSDKDEGKRPRKPSDEEEEELSPKKFVAESAADKFINKERLETSFKGKADAPQGCEIYCGNLPPNVTEDELRELFEECGLITRINKLGNKGIAFITFSNPESAQKAAEYNNSPYKGKLLNINITTNRPPKGGFGSRGDEGSKFNFKGKPSEVTVTNEICIRNLNFNSSEEGLRELFSECGQVTRCYLPKFRDSGKPMGVCFITFTTVEAAKRAVEYDQTEIDGRTVSIQYALPRNRFSNRGRAAKGRFTTGSPRASTFARSSGKFDGERRGGSPKFSQDRSPFGKSTGANTVSNLSEDAKPKSILFDDDDDE